MSIIGITGKVGRLLADQLLAEGQAVAGLVRQEDQRAELSAKGVEVSVGDITALNAPALAGHLQGADVVVYAAGSNGGAADVTRLVDEEGVAQALDASKIAGVRRFILVSVIPEAWRERSLSDDEEFYFAAKKRAEVAVTRSDLEWVILRPSLLTDEGATGLVSMGPAEMHDEVTRADAASALAAIVREPRIRRQILELNRGNVPTAEAVAQNVSDL